MSYSLQQNFYNLPSLLETELGKTLSVIEQKLSEGHLTSIVNSFLANTMIFENGMVFVKIKGLSNILRTGSFGLERPLVYLGVVGVLNKSEIITINGEEYISGPSLVGLIEYRINHNTGKTKDYLNYSFKIYREIVNSSKIRDLKDHFLENINSHRVYLKKKKIEKYNITSCEFSGAIFTVNSEVEFAHIESVAYSPLKALDIDNGVIVLKKIHKDMTRLNLHTLKEMYNFCIKYGYSTDWLK